MSKSKPRAKRAKAKDMPIKKCVKCGALGVCFGGTTPEWIPVERDVCIDCVGNVVGREHAEESFRKLHPKGRERRSRKKRARKSG